jgi:transcription antitermination factor NusG
MNERIKQLALQAGYSKDYLEIGLPEIGVPSNMEKFAELIVQECLDQLIISDQGIYWSREQIKQHFGIKSTSTSIKVGSRVKVVSGFNVGAKGTVSYIEPTGRMWVMRDGASTDVFYTHDEVVRIEE